ncbi:MAG: 8-oxo-dGTP diphosphatase [Ruminococcaceae bacterium]|nr:8-oxo-dGTP diphosphatase [Oscillospiraceae bacterium]
MKNSTLCYIEKDGKYLMLHRIKKENDVNRDKWIGIGGKFEDGESPEECMLREAKEETGLDVNCYTFRAIVTFVSDIYETEYMHLFTADGFTGNISECDEGCLEWIEKEKLYDLTLWEGDRIFLKLIEKPCPFFSLKLEYRGDNLVSAILDGKKIK